MIAATAPPPAPSTAVAANCAEPANTSADITIGATLPMTGCGQDAEGDRRAPAAATAYGIPMRTPSRKRSRGEPAQLVRGRPRLGSVARGSVAGLPAATRPAIVAGRGRASYASFLWR